MKSLQMFSLYYCFFYAEDYLNTAFSLSNEAEN